MLDIRHHFVSKVNFRWKKSPCSKAAPILYTFLVMDYYNNKPQLTSAAAGLVHPNNLFDVFVQMLFTTLAIVS